MIDPHIFKQMSKEYSTDQLRYFDMMLSMAGDMMEGMEKEFRELLKEINYGSPDNFSNNFWTVVRCLLEEKPPDQTMRELVF